MLDPEVAKLRASRRTGHEPRGNLDLRNSPAQSQESLVYQPIYHYVWEPCLLVCALCCACRCQKPGYGREAHERRRFRHGPPYQYKSIPACGDDTSPSIRTLSLNPSGDKRAPLTGTLEQHTLDEIAGKYEALSYEWGRPVFPEEILVDGKSLNITRNLCDALLQFRRSRETRRLWIDAVCINQADVGERTAQLKIMGRIYSSAKCTLGWLGHPADLEVAQDAVDYVVQAASLVREQEFHRSRDYHRPFRALDHFFQLPYFTRMWIVQELVLAREVQLVWGIHRLSFQDILLVLRNVRGCEVQESAGLGALAFKDSRWLGPRNKTSDILDLMEVFRSRDCSDDRDRIAALQGLWGGHTGPMRFSVDYAESVESNYIRFAKMFLSSTQFGRLLYYAALCNYCSRARERKAAVAGVFFRRKPASLPSWIPDWRSMGKSRSAVSAKTSLRMAYDSHVGDDNALVTRGWILEDRIPTGRRMEEGQEVLPFPSGLDRRIRSSDWVLKDEPISRDTDKICTFVKGDVHRICQFVIRESPVGSNRFILVAPCEWTEETSRALRGRDPNDVRPTEPVEIVLI